MNWEAIFSGALSGGLIGALAAVIAPWSKWGIEKKRLRFARRREKLIAWRERVQSIAATLGNPIIPVSRDVLRDNTNFRLTALFTEIAPYLQPTTIRAIESMGVEKDAQRAALQMVLTDLVSLEKQWGII